MVVQGNTYKIFVGNLSEDATNDELRTLFEAHGTVVEADVMKNYGFVHMLTEEQGNNAIAALNKFNFHGRPMVVEASTGGKKGPAKKTKIFVGNLHKDTRVDELRSLFAAYGEVIETDILSHYGFVHMSNETEAMEAIRNLDGYELNGLELRVQESTSRVRQTPGMGNPDQCYRCGSKGHWSKECPRDRSNRDRGSFRGGRDSRDRMPRDRDRMHRGMRGGDRGPYGRDSYYDRMDRLDRMDRRGYGSRYDPYPPPPPMSRDRYRPLPPPPPIPSSSERYYEDSPPPSDRRFYTSHQLPPPAPLAVRDLYDRRGAAPPPPPPPSIHDDYFSYGRRSPPPPPRYSGHLPPPSSLGGYRYPHDRY